VARTGARLSPGGEVDAAEGRRACHRRGEAKQIPSAGLNTKLLLHVVVHLLV